MKRYLTLCLTTCAVLLAACSQEEQKQREADMAIEEAREAQAEADAKRARAVAKQVRADAEARADALEDHAAAVEKRADADDYDRPYTGTDEKERIRYEARREARRLERERLLPAEDLEYERERRRD